MYKTQKVVGDFFEEKLMKIFDLVREDAKSAGLVPDLISRDGTFYIEVKASAYTNGGVIKRKQLYRFDEMINTRRFYAFAYHSITKDMQRDYKNKERLRKSLDLKSLYIFPFSIVKSHYENSREIIHPQNDFYVQLRESEAEDIFDFGQEIWKHLHLDVKDYNAIKPHEKVMILTRQGNLEKEILQSFHPEFI